MVRRWADKWGNLIRQPVDRSVKIAED